VSERVWIVLEGPDMTYYGDAEVHGVYASQAEAEARAAELNGGTTHNWDCIQVQEWGIGEKSDEEAPPPRPRTEVASVSDGFALALMGIYSGATMSSPQTAELARKRRWWRR
jgi:hypothetical protein